MRKGSRCTVLVQERLPVSQEKLWDFLYNNLDWHPTIQRSTMDNNLRTIYLTDGAVIQEHIDKVDPIRFEYEYHFVKSPYPMSDYHATIRITKISDDECEVTWSSQFFPDGDTAENLISLVESIYKDGLRHLKEIVSKTAT